MFDTDEHCAEDGENNLDHYNNNSGLYDERKYKFPLFIFVKDIRSQFKKDDGSYDHEWDEPDLHMCSKNNTTDSPFVFGDVKHIRLQEYLRTDNMLLITYAFHTLRNW